MRRCAACAVVIEGEWTRCPLCAAPLSGAPSADPLPAVPLPEPRPLRVRLLALHRALAKRLRL